MEELKRIRTLSSEITQKGVALYDLLGKEVQLREARNQALSKSFEQDEMSRLIKQSLTSANQEMTKLDTMIDNIQTNLANLDSKLEKKTLELERSKKRLVTMRKIRPAFMDEYEALQAELKAMYTEYVKRFRCLAFLQNQIEEMNRIESERKAEERLSKAEYTSNGRGDDFMAYNKAENILYSGSEDSSEDEEHRTELTNAAREFMNSRASKINAGARNSSTKRPQGSSFRRGGGTRQVYGSMLGGGDDSGDSESELILVDGDNSDLGTDDDEDDEDETALLQNERSRSTQRVATSGRMMNGGPAQPIVPMASTSGYNNNNMNFNNNYNNSMTTQYDDDAAAGIIVPNGNLRGGPPTLANGGKGYPTDPFRQQQMNRVVTNGSDHHQAVMMNMTNGETDDRPKTSGKKYPSQSSLSFGGEEEEENI